MIISEMKNNRWVYLKYEIRKFTIRFLKNFAKKVRKETQSVKKKVKHFESSVTNYHNNLQYIEYKEKLDTIYSKKDKREKDKK